MCVRYDVAQRARIEGNAKKNAEHTKDYKDEIDDNSVTLSAKNHIRAYLLLKQFNLSDEYISTLDNDSVNLILEQINHIKRHDTYYMYDVSDYSRLTNAKPYKKDGKFDSSKHKELMQQAIKIRKAHIQYVEPLPKVDIFTFMSNMKAVPTSTWEQIKDSYKLIKTIYNIYLSYICSNSGQ